MKILNIKIVNQIEIQLYDFERVIRLVDYPPSLNCSRVASEHHSGGGHVVHRGVHVDHEKFGNFPDNYAIVGLVH